MHCHNCSKIESCSCFTLGGTAWSASSREHTDVDNDSNVTSRSVVPQRHSGRVKESLMFLFIMYPLALQLKDPLPPRSLDPIITQTEGPPRGDCIEVDYTTLASPFVCRCLAMDPKIILIFDATLSKTAIFRTTDNTYMYICLTSLISLASVPLF